MGVIIRYGRMFGVVHLLNYVNVILIFMEGHRVAAVVLTKLVGSTLATKGDVIVSTKILLNHRKYPQRSDFADGREMCQTVTAGNRRKLECGYIIRYYYYY